MGVHTGDSITVAPAQTLSGPGVPADAQRGRSRCCGRGGCGDRRVQRPVRGRSGHRPPGGHRDESPREPLLALASKATGFPIAKIAARLAVGYTLDEIPNDITEVTRRRSSRPWTMSSPRSPRWAFEKFQAASTELGTSMQSVGEVMAIGAHSASRCRRDCAHWSRAVWDSMPTLPRRPMTASGDADLMAACAVPTPERIFQLEALLRRGEPVEAVHAGHRRGPVVPRSDRPHLHRETGARDHRAGRDESGRLAPGQAARVLRRPTRIPVGRRAVRGHRGARGRRGCCPPSRRWTRARPEFEATTPYHYSTYEDTDEIQPARKPRVLILGSGPNRIGQGIEFDYCCVHAGQALRAAGYETVMVNCNPETSVHRLRHQRPALLRAAHLRGRGQRDRGRKIRWA